jgi:hypothetical protein
MATTQPDKYGHHWYPSSDQLKDPASTQRAMKQVLDQLYALQDQHDKLQAAHSALQAKVNAPVSGPPPGSGPTDTQILGLRVEPVDTQVLANGAALKFNKARGTFSFS